MVTTKNIMPKKFKSYTYGNIDQIPQMEKLPKELRTAIRIVSSILPFRVNNYVIDELIDWDKIPDDPIFQLTFPQPGMLSLKDFNKLIWLNEKGCSEEELLKEARIIQKSMNPHPAGQLELNVPKLDGEVLKGMQHKYNETVLLFPTQGQTCHAYCTYCFRWAQFIGMDNLKFATSDIDSVIEYIDNHPEVTDLLITGGDPLIMREKGLRKYIDPILKKRPGNLSSIRFGTKVPAYWPYRFLTDKDADDLMRMFEDIVGGGYHLSVMSHFSHTRELQTNAVDAALRRIRSTGAEIRCQAPLIKHINDDPEVWSEMWKAQVKLGAVPYYMFVERDTGPKAYFHVPLARAYEIFTDAYKNVSGLCRTVRGPSMSATPGKVLVDGVTEINGEKVFALKFIQARDPEWVNRLFFAKYDEKASWLNDLKPAFGEKEFFFEKRLREIKAAKMS